MTKDETKIRCRNLYLSWDRKHEKGPAKGKLFRAYLMKQPDFYSFTCGRTGMHQVVQVWVDEWAGFYQ